MIKTTFLILLVFLYAQSEVVELTDESFKDFTTKNNYAFVYFYSPSCKYCLVLEPEFKKLSEEFNQTNVKFAKIDATSYESLSQKYGVKGYPSLFFFDYTFVLPYQQDRSYQSMKKWINHYLQDRIVSISAQELAQSKKPYIVLSEGTAHENKVLNQSVHGIEDIQAYRIGEGSKGKISFHSSKGEFYFEGDIERIQLRNWIKQHLQTALIPLDKDDKVNKYLFNAGKPSLLIVLAGSDKQSQVYNSIQSVCEQNRQKVNCLQIVPKYESFKGAHGYFQVQDTNKSVIGLVKQNMNIAYRMDIPFSRITNKNLQAFIDGSLKDEIKRLIDNVTPTSVKFEAVKVLTASNIDQILKNNKHVFVNFYQSNDQVSLVFSRPYESFAKIANEEDDLKGLIVAAIDCVQFKVQCDKMDVTYFPTLRFYIEGIPIEYERTQKLPQIPHLTKFIASRINKNIQTTNTESLSRLDKPILVIHAQNLSNKIRVLPAGLGQIKCYFVKSEEKQPRVQLHLDYQIVQYGGDFSVSSIKRWVKSKTDALLADMMKQNPDDRIVEAVKNKQPIVFLLDVEKDKSAKIKGNLGSLCKKLELCGAYADSSHPGFKSLLEWIGLEKPSQSKLIYSDISQDAKYLYSGSLDKITKELLQKFVNDVKAGQISKLGLKQQTQELEVEEKQADIVEQL